MKNGAFTIEDFRERREGDGALILPNRTPVFRFNQRCHPGAGFYVEYSEGEIHMVCNVTDCRTEVIRIAVAER